MKLHLKMLKTFEHENIGKVVRIVCVYVCAHIHIFMST